MFLLMAVMLAIVMPYALMRGTYSYMDCAAAMGMLVAYVLMAGYCHLGQTFVSQVSSGTCVVGI